MNLGATKVHHLNPAFWKAINALLHQIISFLWVFIISQFLLFYAHFHGAREEEKKYMQRAKNVTEYILLWRSVVAPVSR